MISCSVFLLCALKIGIVADPHLELDPQHPTCLHLKDAFDYFARRGVDGVVMPGDLTSHGLIPELQNVADIWKAAFPGDLDGCGRKVEKLFVYGDHDVGGYMQDKAKITDEQRRQWTIPWNDRKAVWERTFGEEWRPATVKDVGGYRFYLAHLTMDRERPQDFDAGVHIDELEALFRDQPPPSDPKVPFFYVQHLVLRDTISPRGDHGVTRKLLARYPNAVTFSGSYHVMATDEKCAWQGEFTAFEAPGLVAPLLGCGGYENGAGSGDQRPHQIRPVPQLTPINWPVRSWQGLYMTVEADRVMVERIDFADGQPVGPAWGFPLPATEAKPLSHAYRRDRSPVPQFGKGARAKVEVRQGVDFNRAPSEQYAVSFPVLKSPRVYDYEVTVVLERDEMHRIATQRRFVSPEAIRSVRYEPDVMTALIPTAEICSNFRLLIFEVRPVDAFGRKGEAISAVYGKR